MSERVQTTKISGGADYAKVAERLKKFREDWPNSKTETDHKTLENGVTIFKAWIWKDKTEYMEVIKSGVSMRDARGTADADGDASGVVGKKEKDFEKLQSIAIGRALAMLGYMASGEIASFEEMELYYKEKREREAQYIEDQLIAFENAKTLDELKDLWIACTAKNVKELVEAKDKRKSELEAKAESKPKAPKKKIVKTEKAVPPQEGPKNEAN